MTIKVKDRIVHPSGVVETTYEEASPYRMPAPKEPEPVDTRTRVGAGRLEKKPREHVCKKPGWWARLWYAITRGDVWTCDHCGQAWEWRWLRSEEEFSWYALPKEGSK